MLNKINSLLQKPLVRLFGGIFVIVLPILFWLYPSGVEKRNIEIAVTKNAELIAGPSVVNDSLLEFRYNGDKVSNLISTKIRIKNSGNKPILEEDFVEGLTILFPDNVKIISYKLSQVQPITNLSLYQQEFITQEKNRIKFVPVLVNSGDIFDIDILTTENLQPKLQTLTSGLQDPLSDIFDLGNSPVSEYIKYKKGDIQLSYKIYGISKIDEVSKISTNAEKRIEAREDLLSTKGFILTFSFVFLSIIIFILTYKGAKDRIIKVGEILFFTLLFIVSCISFGVEIYNAFFLSVY